MFTRFKVDITPPPTTTHHMGSERGSAGISIMPELFAQKPNTYFTSVCNYLTIYQPLCWLIRVILAFRRKPKNTRTHIWTATIRKWMTRVCEGCDIVPVFPTVLTCSHERCFCRRWLIVARELVYNFMSTNIASWKPDRASEL